MDSLSPVGALWRGALAGAAGSAAMDVWFAAFGKLMPPPREGAFVPPETKQLVEMPTETLARRAVSGVAMRGELEGAAKYRAGRMVHYAYGAGWGALFGLLAESVPVVRRIPGAAAFGAFVWSASDHVMLPILRLGPWPRGVTPKGHAFWLATHLVYAGGVLSAYRQLRPHSIACALTGIALAKLGLERTKPSLLKRAATAATRLRPAAVPA